MNNKAVSKEMRFSQIKTTGKEATKKSMGPELPCDRARRKFPPGKSS